MKKIEKSLKLGGRKLTLSTGHVAGQADGAVIASYGETVVLATVVAQPLIDNPGYFPLTVEYQERLYAGGRIKGSRWVKREGRPTDEEILTARLIDRSIRPLFPKDYLKDVQVIITVLSVDLENSPDIVAATAVSAALSISPIPWKGPVAILRVGMKNGEYLINPTVAQLKESKLDLVVSFANNAVVMIEAGSKEVTEKQVLEGMSFAQKESKALTSFIEDFAKSTAAKKEKVEKNEISASLKKKIEKLSGGNLKALIPGLATKKESYKAYDDMKSAVLEEFEEEDRHLVGLYLDEYLCQQIRDMVLSGKRPDGRAHDEIRDLSAVISLLPRTHGSAIFNRGNTQALTITTLGAPSLEQLIETAEGEESKRYIHHYSMPPYSVGETGRLFPKRREIGHGALAEKALLPVIPDEEKFPYTIRLVTEILSSNGSTSMASTCGSTLSLMDAGVPIKAPVAGIAMGLIVKDEKKFAVLTDIVGLEDGNGDMDLKVAGTKDGITVLQLDVKTLKLSLPMLTKALEQAKDARLKILKVMQKVIKDSRSGVSEHAPKIKKLKIDKAKIGEVIGPGGKIIRGIIAQTGAQIDVEDDGTVIVSATKENEVADAISIIEGLTKDVLPGEIYEGEVKRLEKFGIFVEILPGKDGMVHISDMSNEYVNDPSDIVSLGDNIKVKVKEIDNLGRINLTMKLDSSSSSSKSPKPSGERYGRRAPRGRGTRDNRSNRNPRGRRDARGSSRQSGPHFPATRYVKQDR